jgi:hypothetical protein
LSEIRTNRIMASKEKLLALAEILDGPASVTAKVGKASTMVHTALDELGWCEQTGECADAMPSVEDQFLAAGGIVNAEHNGYGYSEFFIRTPTAVVGLGNPGVGEYVVDIKGHDAFDFEEHDPAAFGALLTMIEEGVGDDGCIALYEGSDKVAEVVKQFDSVNLPRPFLLDATTFKLKGRA